MYIYFLKKIITEYIHSDFHFSKFYIQEFNQSNQQQVKDYL